jgi:hypothetical protein
MVWNCIRVEEEPTLQNIKFVIKYGKLVDMQVYLPTLAILTYS